MRINWTYRKPMTEFSVNLLCPFEVFSIDSVQVTYIGQDYTGGPWLILPIHMEI
jgi:hypothetical protein